MSVKMRSCNLAQFHDCFAFSEEESILALYSLLSGKAQTLPFPLSMLLRKSKVCTQAIIPTIKPIFILQITLRSTIDFVV